MINCFVKDIFFIKLKVKLGSCGFYLDFFIGYIINWLLDRCILILESFEFMDN